MATFLTTNVLWFALWQTIYMVFLSSLVGIVGGLFLGVFLTLAQKTRFKTGLFFYHFLSVCINIIRSLPFLILMIALIPLTRFLLGTAIGTNAAIVSFSIAAVPFFARLVQNALEEVDPGVMEAAEAMGATLWQKVFGVMLPEAKPALVKGATLTIVSLISYSPMAGVVGGGGLGELAIEYGYQRFDIPVMLGTVVVLVALVQGVQWLGHYFQHARKLRGLWVLFLLLSAGCAWDFFSFSALKITQLKVGIVAGPNQEILAVAAKEAKARYGMLLEPVVFNDYILPNEALNAGSIDANIFQHQPYLEAQIKARAYQLVAIGKTFVYPMGFYSRKIQTLDALKEGDVVAIPNDPSNEARALQLLAKYQLISLKKDAGIGASLQDIESNPRHLQFKTLDAAQLPRVFEDAVLVGLTNDYVKNAGFTVNEALMKEDANVPYANLIVARADRKNDPNLKVLVKLMHSQAVIEETNRLFPGGAAIPAWDVHDARLA